MPKQVTHTVGVLAALGTEALYAFSFVFTKDAVSRVDPVTLLGWRFVVAFCALLLLMAFKVVRVRVTKTMLAALLVLAVLQPILYYSGETIGVARTTASESAIIIASIPVVALLLTWAFQGRRPTRRQVVGIAFSLVGVLLTVVSGGIQVEADWVGYGFVFGAVLAFALYTVLAERAYKSTGVEKTFVMLASGAVVFGGAALVSHTASGTLPDLLAAPVHHPRLIWAIGYLALGSSLGAFFLQNVAISRLGSGQFATFIGISTVVAILASAVFLGERLTPLQVVGSALVLLGVYVANRGARRLTLRRKP